MSHQRSRVVLDNDKEITNKDRMMSQGILNNAKFELQIEFYALKT